MGALVEANAVRVQSKDSTVRKRRGEMDRRGANIERHEAPAALHAIGRIEHDGRGERLVPRRSEVRGRPHDDQGASDLDVALVRWSSALPPELDSRLDDVKDGHPWIVFVSLPCQLPLRGH